jgi:hypothetical protein
MLESEYDVGKDVTRSILTDNLVKQNIYVRFVLYSLTETEKITNKGCMSTFFGNDRQ